MKNNTENTITRKDIDDPWKRCSSKNSNSYKNRKFNGNRTAVDEYTGKTVYYSKNGKNADSSSGRHYTTQTTSNIDHVVPIDVLKQRYGDNLTAEQYRKLANRDFNLALTNERLNKSKSGNSNFKYIISEYKKGNKVGIKTSAKMINKQISAEIAIIPESAGMLTSNAIGRVADSVNLSGGQVENIKNAAGKGTEEALVTLMVSSINNIYASARGEKSASQAAKDVAGDVGCTLVSKGGLDFVQHTVSDICKKCGEKQLSKVALSELPLGEISTVITSGRIIEKMVSGEITQEECVGELLINGLGHIAFYIGSSTPLGPIGGAVLSLVVTNVAGAICNSVMKVINESKTENHKIAHFINIANDALDEISKQRETLKCIVENEFNRWDEGFDNGFDIIFSGIYYNNTDEVVLGLNTILSVFDAECAFQTMDEFNEFFDDTNAVFTL
jgi:hypothetical protein